MHIFVSESIYNYCLVAERNE